ncbi:hypothetical protein Q4490_00130 [Neptunomonas phycophila]|uniref:Uncharacterized protein n=1 Tax=Neptunomonas phycophila TaxID=1572645 RepID=A0AAW7XCP5_9GAMM|nr:hypothetical protein [Neptunomonas phycophila]MDO6451956.1 hypothetical protein [Neptunomonas phycophila]
MPVDKLSSPIQNEVPAADTTADDKSTKTIQNAWMPLFENCKEKKTGTLFIATDENKAGQVVLNYGRLVGVAYSGLVNESAIAKLSELARTSELRFSFSSNLQYPLLYVLDEDEGDALLESLGFIAEVEPEATPVIDYPTAEDEENSQENTKPKSERIYRGQRVLEESPVRPKSHSRRYRGQVVSD